MTEQVLAPVKDAKFIAELLRRVDDDGEAEFHADLFTNYAENHSFDDRWTEIGALDEFIEQHA